MNELNLQNPEFRRRIDTVTMDDKWLTVQFNIHGKYMKFVTNLYSRNSPIDNTQYWVNDSGRAINTLEEFDRLAKKIL